MDLKGSGRAAATMAERRTAVTPSLIASRSYCRSIRRHIHRTATPRHHPHTTHETENTRLTRSTRDATIATPHHIDTLTLSGSPSTAALIHRGASTARSQPIADRNRQAPYSVSPAMLASFVALSFDVLTSWYLVLVLLLVSLPTVYFLFFVSSPPNAPPVFHFLTPALQGRFHLKTRGPSRARPQRLRPAGRLLPSASAAQAHDGHDRAGRAAARVRVQGQHTIAARGVLVHSASIRQEHRIRRAPTRHAAAAQVHSQGPQHAAHGATRREDSQRGRDVLRQVGRAGRGGPAGGVQSSHHSHCLSLSAG